MRIQQINKPIIKPNSDKNPELVSDSNATKEGKFSLGTLDNTKIKESLKNSLSADSSNMVNEEQLQVSVVSALLSNINEKASDSFVKSFSSHVAKGESVEDSVKLALKSLVKKGELSDSDASTINGISFRASQLDKNLDALYDGKGGPGDTTIAVDKLDVAIDKASAILSEMKSGVMKFETRSLDAPSNIKGVSQNISSGNISSPTSGSVDAGAGFLWKPTSDNNGKLVVLFPPSVSGSIQTAGLYKSVPPTSEDMIESGRYSGVGNGGRTHFRFSKSGAQYTDGLYAVGILRDGSYVSYKITETSKRQ